MDRIYIIGPVGSGKTTLSKKLSLKYNIKRYELDKVVWDDDHGNIKRTDEEINQLFNQIIENKSWIIEDIGRSKFIKGREQSEIIYYIKISRVKSYLRVTKRWLKQKLNIESYNHPPTFKQLLYFISTVNSYYKKEKDKLDSLKKYQDKLVFINKKDLKRLL